MISVQVKTIADQQIFLEATKEIVILLWNR